MSALNAGDSFPADVTFGYIPWTDEKKEFTTCGAPQTYEASKLWADKKVVLVSVPGAFTPTCSANHLPSYIASLPALKQKGVDVVAFIAFNDPFVMSAWGKANGVTGDDILFLSDIGSKFSKSLGWTIHDDRTARYAMIIDHGKVTYAEKEPAPPAVTVSGVDAVLPKL
ncbi:peroxisomal matrix protein [Arthroderma uncinatum]|uniref:peroxisomal matrix protein n=1 Tax=Arthroderma uncinatum TaxID=74035 RepID=UPI00144A9F34|nr:peroxisomal matrix protein [Arthroderma uncinatum]KAF3491384.1 peroxisomal matrix protein [Arthroderma uncinatum]